MIRSIMGILCWDRLHMKHSIWIRYGSCPMGILPTKTFFNQIYPEDEFYFIIGADSLFAIETWAHPERLFPTCTVLATYRDEINTRAEMEEQIQYLTRKYDAHIRLLATPLMSVSSSELRREIKSCKSISAYVPSSL